MKRLLEKQANLYHHKKKCNFKDENTKLTIVENNDLKEHNKELKGLVCKLITENNEIKNTILKENQELRAQVNELIPKIGNNNTTNIKQKFNINIFLNEQCRDAINMDDFLKQIEVSMQQLDLTKKKGITEGLSNVFIENMNKLSLYERPLHCTDPQQETVYIKCDEDKKETVKLLRQDTKPCPKCGQLIYKIQGGCDQMYCVKCHTAFSWKTGRRVNGVIHNPHYYAFQRMGNSAVVRNPGAVVCGGLPEYNMLRRNLQRFIGADNLLSPSVSC